MNDEILMKMREAVADKFNIGVDEAAPDKSFEFDFGADSLDMYELLAGMESEFGISITDEDLGEIKTIADAAGCVSRKMRETSPD